MEMVWKTVPCSGSSMREAALLEFGSAPLLDVDSCVGGSETRSTAVTRDCLIRSGICTVVTREEKCVEVIVKTRQ